MFKITIYSHGQSKEHSFAHKSRVVLGKAGSEGIDLPLEGEQLASHHLTIEAANNVYVLYNTSNDPFATLNGEPFGKRKLRDNDIIHAGQSTLRFQLVSESPEGKDLPINEQPLENILDSAIQSKNSNDFSVPFHSSTMADLERELEDLEELPYENDYKNGHLQYSQNEIELDEIESLVREVEAMEWEEVQALTLREHPTNSTPKAPSPYTHLNTGNADEIEPPLKGVEPSKVKANENLASSQNDAKKKPFTKPNETSKLPANNAKSTFFPYIHWKWWIVLSLLTLLLLFLLGGSFYYHMQDKRRLEETKAAQGVADIAMALMYARVNQIIPPNQNWSNPAYLKKNLGAVLSSKYQILATIDAHGQFSNSPYLLRIYPNKDLSQFIVIAQPAPSPLQSIFPRTTIIVDSKEMELRKLKDLRELNRVLATAKPFENFDTNSSSAIIKSGELIPLNSLTLSNSKLGFSPPRSLAVLRPGSDNRIYNAPRYYLFGERILNKIVALENEGYEISTASVAVQDLHELESLPNLVLYSTQGMTKALHAQRALATLSPDSKLLVGYLKLNPEGKVLSSQLLMKHALTPGWQKNRTDTEIALKETKDTPFLNDTEILEQNKFQLSLQSIQIARKEKLTLILNQIKALLDNQVTSPSIEFVQNYQLLNDELISVIATLNEENALQLRYLMRQYSDEPLDELLKKVQAAGLSQLLTSSPSPNTDNSDQLKEAFESKLSDIKQARNLESLEAAVQTAIQWIASDTLQDPQLLSGFQKQTSETVIQKLGDFLLSPQDNLPQTELVANKRLLLETVLSHAWIKDDEIKHYFLNEFDILSSQEE
ncbi:MAG: FHA domain-containing protein [Parachlamydiales bacterium]|jgi:hypothetical protein